MKRDGGDGDGDGGRREGEVGGSGCSGVTDAGNGGNATTGAAHQNAGVLNGGGNKDSGLTTVTTAEGEMPLVTEAAPSPVWLAVTRCGYLVLGFVVGVAAAATAMLFLKRAGPPPQLCVVPT
ncbi:hypothetical protein GUJ93_ZPchr0008g12993 [Zizania palustris]|uniref:Uncharacterized protein n=1 Tax=Zizania palustris TaxID=103762 RepID=A0A8J5RK97_ZIZPA|nr:hypothetical protein GUJ93_ZPchr0008g12993 [Zizania palustris]